MLNWIKNKIESFRFIRRPLKIRSYTDVVKERVFAEIDKFRSNVLNMNLDDISNGIKLIDHMHLDCGTHPEAFYNLQEIKRCFSMMQSGAFDPSNPYGPFFNSGLGGFYANYNNMYSQYQNKGNPYNQYGQYQC
jgi:hypothetical protein